MQCQTIKTITVPACEPFTAFPTVLPNTALKLTVDYAGIVINTTGTTDASGNYPIVFGVFPAGMVNEYDRFTLTFTDLNGAPVDVDGEGNSVFIIQPE